MADLRAQAKRKKKSSRKPLMTPEQVRCTASRLIEFGSHSLTHPWLTRLKTPELRHEICDSLDRCEALTGSPPAAFAYPYGMFDERSEQLAREAGFACACSTMDLAVSRRSRTFALPRLRVGDWDAARLQRVLAHVHTG
jgi:peptidoglycan/xylan/chitin deacetylase (PgdA/CDA1 family)